MKFPFKRSRPEAGEATSAERGMAAAPVPIESPPPQPPPDNAAPAQPAPSEAIQASQAPAAPEKTSFPEYLRRTLTLEAFRRRTAEAKAAAAQASLEKAEAERQREAARLAAHAARQESLWAALIAIMLFLVGSFSVIITQDAIGYAWDEAYYYEPAKLAAQWIDAVAGGTISPLDKEMIDRHWEERHEHPSVQKILSGLSLMAFERSLGPIAAMRLPMAFLFGGSLCLIFFLGRRAWGLPEGLIAAGAYGAMPQVFGYSHFATMEPPLIFMTLLTVYCFARGLDSRFWSVLTGVALGALLATKINGFFLIPPLVLWGYIYRRRDVAHNVIAMMFIAPVVFVALWPWLWPNPPARVLDYLQFHAGHQQTAVWFEGRKWGYGGPNAPWYYPSVIIGATVPVGIIAFSILGVIVALVGAFWYPLPVLYLIVALVTWIVASAPGTPKYDGARLFLPLFPFMALMAAAGAHLPLSIARMWDDWRARRRTRRSDEVKSTRSTKSIPSIEPSAGPAPRGLTRFLAASFFALVTVEGAIGILLYHPHTLSYFNVATGGIRGAERRGFETTFWGEAVNPAVLRELNSDDLIRPGSSVKVLALHEKVFEHYQQWGMLRRDVRFTGDPPFDYHLLQWRRGFFGVAESLLADSGKFPPSATWSARGVTLLSLHRTSMDFYEEMMKRRQAEKPAPPPAPAPPPETETRIDDVATTPTL